MLGPGFRLGLATAPERIARDRLTFDAWGDRLTLAQYLDRERTLRQTEHGRLAMRSWVLRLPNGFVAASCETFRLPLSPSGAVEVVASVYVERALRGVKMASRLLEAVVESRRAAELDALLLFSEVGTALYARVGFRRLPAPTRVWSALPAAASPEGPRGAPPEPLSSLERLLALRREARRGPLDLGLTEPIVEWHLARARCYAQALGRPEPGSIGAADGGVVALWAPDFKAEVLRVVEVSGPAGASLEAVAASARGEAARLGLRTVELWDDAHSLRLAGPAPLEREEPVPMGLAFTPRGELLLGPLSRAAWA